MPTQFVPLPFFSDDKDKQGHPEPSQGQPFNFLTHNQLSSEQGVDVHGYATSEQPKAPAVAETQRLQPFHLAADCPRQPHAFQYAPEASFGETNLNDTHRQQQPDTTQQASYLFPQPAAGAQSEPLGHTQTQPSQESDRHQQSPQSYQMFSQDYPKMGSANYFAPQPAHLKAAQDAFADDHKPNESSAFNPGMFEIPSLKGSDGRNPSSILEPGRRHDQRDKEEAIQNQPAFISEEAPLFPQFYEPPKAAPLFTPLAPSPPECPAEPHSPPKPLAFPAHLGPFTSAETQSPFEPFSLTPFASSETVNPTFNLGSSQVVSDNDMLAPPAGLSPFPCPPPSKHFSVDSSIYSKRWPSQHTSPKPSPATSPDKVYDQGQFSAPLGGFPSTELPPNVNVELPTTSQPPSSSLMSSLPVGFAPSAQQKPSPTSPQLEISFVASAQTDILQTQFPPQPPLSQFLPDARRKSNESASHHLSFPAIPFQSAPSLTEETMSLKSYTSGGFVLQEADRAKTCSRCAKPNEVLANFCCRCGAQIGSPVFSPDQSSQTAEEITNQMGNCYISEKPAALLPAPQQQSFIQSNLPSAPTTITPHPPYSQVPFGVATMTQQIPAEEKRESRNYPVLSFGFGGLFVATFPILQTRFNPNGQPINSFRPSFVYKGSIDSFPKVKAALVDPILVINKGLPFLGKTAKELSGILSRLKGEAELASYGLLFGLFDLLLQSHGKVFEAVSRVLQLLPESSESWASSSAPHSKPQQLPSPGALAELSNLLARGDKIGACAFASKEGLWSHALILASQVGPDMFNQVVGNFSKFEFPSCHPLRILYSAFGSQYQSAQQELWSCSNEIKLSWTWHLRLLLSNRSSEMNMLINTLGDALWNSKNPIPASFCYVLVQNDAMFYQAMTLGSCGSPDMVSVRILELYEAVRRTFDPSYLFIAALPSKLGFAQTLLDYGLPSAAIFHTRSLGNILNKNQIPDSQLLNSFNSLNHCVESFAESNPSIALPQEGSGWLPKVSGIMDVLDRGLNKVIGVEETSRPKTPQLPQINVAAEVKPRPVENVYYSSSFPLQQPLLPQQQHQWQQQQPPYIANESGKIDFNESLAPIGGFDPFARKNSIEAKLQGVFSPTPPAEETFGFKPPQQHQVPEAMTHPHPTWQPQPPTAPSQYHQQDFGFQPWQQQPSQAPTSHVPLQQQVEFSSQLRFDGTLGQEQQMSDPRPNSPQGMSQPDFSFGWQQPQPSQQSWQGQASAQLSPTKPGPQRLTSPALTHQYSMPNLAASSQQQQYTQDESAKGMHHAPSEDEFGFSNAALTKLKPSPSAEQAKGSDEKEEQTDSDVDSKGSKFGFIWGIFGRKKDTSSPALSAGISGSNGAKQANLGEPGLSLVYDDKLKKWINKETGAPPVAEAAPPPPPSVSSSQGISGGAASPVSYRRNVGSGSRSKYVDAFNPSSVAAAPRSNLIPIPSFTPLQLENEDQHKAQGQQQPSSMSTNQGQNRPPENFQPYGQFYQGHTQPGGFNQANFTSS